MNSVRGYPDEIYTLYADAHEAAGESALADRTRAFAGLLWRARVAMAVGAVAGLALALGLFAIRAPAFTATARVFFAPAEQMSGEREDGRAASDGLAEQLEILRSSHLMGRVVDKAALLSHPAFNPALQHAYGRHSAVMAPLGGLLGLPGALLRVVGLGTAHAEGEIAGAAEAEARAGEVARRLLAGKIRLEPMPGSRVIAISATTGDPGLSADIVNTLASEYTAVQRDARSTATREATAGLGARVQELKAALDRAEADVAAERARLLAGAAESPADRKRELLALNQALAAAATARAAATIRYREVRAAIDDPAGAIASEALARSAVIGEARARAHALADERAALADEVTPGDRRLAHLDAAIAAVRGEIGGEAERVALVLYRDVTVAADEERRLRVQIRALETRLGERDLGEAKLQALLRDSEATRSLYESVRGRLATVRGRDGHPAEAGAAVIAPAERPDRPDSIARPRLAAVGGALGLGAGFAFTLLLGRLQNTFRTLEDVEEATGLAVLGAIPLLPDAETHGGVIDYVMRRPSSALAEAIRGLRTNLLYGRAEGPPQVVTFTSSVPQEGKTTTSLLLAVTSAQLGKSTIIVDCDLRRPALSGMLGAVGSARGGLRAVLEGTLTLEEACLKDPETGLAILPSRVEPDSAVNAVNAADVLASAGFAALLEKLRRRYALVILDVPPTLSVADARLVAQQSDATFYCIKWDGTPRECVTEGLREFTLVRPNIAGAVVTMIDASRMRRAGTSGGGSTAAADPYHLN